MSKPHRECLTKILAMCEPSTLQVSKEFLHSIAPECPPERVPLYGDATAVELIDALRGALMGLEILGPSASQVIARPLAGTVAKARAILARIDAAQAAKPEGTPK